MYFGRSLIIVAWALLALSPVGVSAQTYTLEAITPGVPDLGTVVSGSAGTTFTIAPGGGVTTGAGGASIRPGTQGITNFTFGVKCLNGSGKSKTCAGNTTVITVKTSANSGTTRAGQITNFTIGTGSGYSAVGQGTATLTITTSSGAIADSAIMTFGIGMAFPILATGTTGDLTSAFQVCIGTSCSPANGKVRVLRPISIVNDRGLDFGIVAPPPVGGAAGDLIVDAQSGVRSTTGGVMAINTSSAGIPAQFTVTGEGGQVVSLAIPSFSLAKAGAPSLTVIPETWSATTSLGSSLGSTGTQLFHIGGSLKNISNATPQGTYTGTMTVTANYN